MVGVGLSEQVKDRVGDGRDSIVNRLQLLYEIVLEIPTDLVRWGIWTEGFLQTLVEDWYAFSSTVLFATLPMGVYFGFIVLHEWIGGTSGLSPLEPIEEPLAIFTGTVLLGVGATYAVRTWSRFRLLLRSPLVSSKPGYEPTELEKRASSFSKSVYRKDKYRYCFWGTTLHLLSLWSLIALENRGFSLQDMALPFSTPSFLRDFVSVMPTHWIIEGGQKLVGDLTLGEGFALAVVFLIPAWLFAYAVQKHILQIKTGDGVKYPWLFITTPWTWLFIWILLVG